VRVASSPLAHGAAAMGGVDAPQDDARGEELRVAPAAPMGGESAQDVAAGDAGIVVSPSCSTVPPKPWDTTTGAAGISFLERRVVYSRRRERVLRKAYEECERITRIYSKTFYLGSSLLPPDKRRAVWSIYVWCRRTDELVDGPRVQQRCASLEPILQQWDARLEDIFAGRPRDALDLTLVDVKERFPGLDVAPFKDMIKGMLMDVEHDRYQTFRDLYVYCYRVAATVGLMTLPIMGAADGTPEGLRRAAEPATALGIALQLTNILRDVGEDRLRGRIYLPLEDLERFNYTEADLFNCVLDDRYRQLMRFQIARARKYFALAEKGIDLLTPESRLPVRASLDMYSGILDVLEENGYDNFHRRAYVPKMQKVGIVPLSLMRTQKEGFWHSVYRIIKPFVG